MKIILNGRNKSFLQIYLVYNGFLFETSRVIFFEKLEDFASLCIKTGGSYCITTFDVFKYLLLCFCLLFIYCRDCPNKKGYCRYTTNFPLGQPVMYPTIPYRSLIRFAHFTGSILRRFLHIICSASKMKIVKRCMKIVKRNSNFCGRRKWENNIAPALFTFDETEKI